MYWSKDQTLISLGGFNTFSYYLDEVSAYSTQKDEWRPLPSLPQEMSNSAATILDNVLYNFGGYHFHSYCSLDLVSGVKYWKSCSLEGDRLVGFSRRGIASVGNKIIEFGSNIEKSTNILEKSGEGADLRLVKAVEGCDYETGSFDSSFCTFRDRIYIFPKQTYNKIYHFSLKEEAWSLFYSG